MSKAFTGFDKMYGDKKEKEFFAKHEREREEYNAEAYIKWTPFDEKRSELINEYCVKENVPKDLGDKHKEDIRQYDFVWGANGNQINELLKEQNIELYEHQKQHEN